MGGRGQRAQRGERELIEIQVPGDSTETAYHEVDGALPIFPLLGALDRNPYWGRVVYTHGGTLDQPLALTRMGYADAATTAGSPWPAFTLVPYWNRRGQAALGTYGAGQWGLQKVPGGSQCAASPTSPQRCVVLEWPLYWSAFDARRQTEGLSWHGTLLEDKVNGTGTYYRRNRVYDGKTGRFTQEDPIGLAGGLNLYGYANGDPVNFSDPFGLKVCFRGSGSDVRRLKQITQEATNTTFDLDKENCVDGGSVRSGRDKSFDGLRAGFVGLVGASSTFDVAFGAEAESPQYSPYRISVFRDADVLAYSTGAWGKCDGGRAAFGFPQVMAHELVHHFPVAGGKGMTGGRRGENDAVRMGDNVVNAALGRPLRCRY